MSEHVHGANLLASLSRLSPSVFTQDTRLLRLTTPLGDDLLAECVHGEEAISEGYRFKVDALCTDVQLQLKTLVGQPALLQLLTAESFSALRPFHGYITAAELTGTNGGFVRYVLTIEPWSKFLSLGRDSRSFQDMTVFDILDVVFGSYAGRGKLACAWRFDLADQGVYPKRSLSTQYQESDLAFAQRLMHEEGLFYFFEHSGDPDSASLGSHTMVIADHNGAFAANPQASVAFTRPGAVMKADSIDRWRTETRLVANAVELSSWDYRTLRQRRASVAGADSAGNSAALLTSRDAPGVYAWQNREQGQRLALNQIQALEALRQVHIGAGTVRSFAPGRRFTLHGHARLDAADSDAARSFVIVCTKHLMHNNLTADMSDVLGKLLGTGATAKTNGEELARGDMRQAGGERALSSPSSRPLYRNRIEAIPACVPFRSTGLDAQGELLRPGPAVRGQQTAIVVGPPGAVIHTDRDHRIKVQFHWQRGTNSHGRMSHPYPDGHTGAPGDDSAGTWVRVLTPMAGANWGSNMLPRVGQEVLVDFLDGDIDRPVVNGTLYNGRGRPDGGFFDGDGSDDGLFG